MGGTGPQPAGEGQLSKRVDSRPQRNPIRQLQRQAGAGHIILLPAPTYLQRGREEKAATPGSQFQLGPQATSDHRWLDQGGLVSQNKPAGSLLGI